MVILKMMRQWCLFQTGKKKHFSLPLALLY